MHTSLLFSDLGWRPCFQQQMTLEELEQTQAGRILAHHRSEFVILSDTAEIHLPITTALPQMTVGDWLLLDERQSFVRLLDRTSLFARKAAGSRIETQLIAANVDTAFIVSAMNHDFNLNRIERFLTLVHDAGAEPVVVLTRKDTCDDAANIVDTVQQLDSRLSVEAVNALDADSVEDLRQWCRKGQTCVFIGSSGVGKSTLVNTLSGQTLQKTGAVRDDDSKGRHTTSGRSMHKIPGGGLLLDTPGMRELQLATSEASVCVTFDDVQQLAEHCRFSDCHHDNEPGCAVKKAVEDGRLEQRRWRNYQKLLREQMTNAASLAEKRAADKKTGKLYQAIQKAKHDSKYDW